MARTSSDWSNVPELARKVIKHSPSHNTFATCAKIETQIQTLITKNNNDSMTLHNSALEPQVKSLISQLKELDKFPESSEELFLYTAIYAHLLLLQQNFSEVIELLSKQKSLQFPKNLKYDYTNVASIKVYTILGAAYEAISDFPEAIKVYQTATPLINITIAKSKEALIWAEHLYYRYGMLATSSTWDDKQVTLAALRGYQSVASIISSSSQRIASDPSSLKRRLSLLNIHFLYLSALLQQDTNDSSTKSELQGVSKLFQTVLFNSANEVKATGSNTSIEQFVEVAFQNWQKSMHFLPPLDSVFEPLEIEETRSLLQTLRQAAKKTFHSCSIMRHLVFVLSSLGHYDEALHAFENYTAYQEKSRIRQAAYKIPDHGTDLQADQVASQPEETGDDDKSVVRVFAKAIDVIVHIKKDGYLAKATADKLSGWLNNEVMILKAQSGHLNGVLAKDLGADLSDGFALVWASVARAYSLFALQASTSDIRVEAYDQAKAAYENSLVYSPKEAQIYFEFALLLAENSQIPRSIEVVQKGIIEDNKHAQSWHLISLLLAALEDHEKALQASSNALNLFSQKSTLMPLEKSQYLQLKMTQVAIKEASEGIDRALELIPEVFVLFGELYPAPLESVYPTDGQEITRTKSKTFVKSIKENRLSRSITRVRSHRTAPSNSSGIPPKSQRMTTKSVDFPLVSNLVDGLARSDLANLWLWTAGLYRRGELFDEAEEALVEAENVNGPSADTHVELGLLIAKYRPALALAEYETALEKDSDSIRAIVALGDLIFDHSHTSFAKQDEKETLGKMETVSINGTANGFKQGYSMSSEPQSELEPELDSEELEPVHLPHDPLFISDEDQLLAANRVQGLLEMVIESGRGFNCAEAWWLLSLFRERNGDKVGATKALWESVGLEESRSVRQYSVSRGEVLSRSRKS